MQGENWPNVYTIRGTKYRDPVQWFKSIDVLREFPAELAAGAHGRPIIGYDNIQNMLTAYRDAIQFAHDQTIRYMNQGNTPEQLVELVALPPHLAEHPWLNEYYGTVKHVVRNIYNGYLGWFEADPWTLDPLSYMERAARYVEVMGARDAVIDSARKAIDDEEFTWAAEILTNVIRIDWEKSVDTNMTLGIQLPDVNEGYGLEIRRGVVQFHESLPAETDVTLVADRDFLNRMIVGDIHVTGEMANAIAAGAPAGGVVMMAAIEAGDIRLEGGTAEDVARFFSYFDPPVDIGSINLIVR
jgi:alkyl sulfatase BDS1-like metallo-beta-lactamase superfamily hydrolase